LSMYRNKITGEEQVLSNPLMIRKEFVMGKK
jgi:hypothetical protein